MDEISDDVRKVAIGLCREDRYTEDRCIVVAKGFTVPKWITYISEAEHLIRQRNAAK